VLQAETMRQSGHAAPHAQSRPAGSARQHDV
jgi:hypothetical protein